ncbi:efflux transporter outer membrane subunit [Neisseria perflava]|uniref:efflux transporter outer membrane subunit n=1 Tax=Neisseria perflava TaxID=33053 RepID=UPI00209EC7A8|nr:efflux transporter outer membrane subunit [Neisseria perflava]MCP1661007.1 NodT family efflux transporter outer membrane factor (OMF) lipoprotein [Neisseria perflava]MCP1772913.1 NodT family efflux transporter outer membrane factor (OMF) lipoprotein [Neisseria perflava]
MKFYSGSRYVSVAAALLLAACARFGAQPPLAEPVSYRLPESRSQLAQDKWWRQLHDKTLNGLIARALQNAPDLRAVQARFEQAQAQLGVTSAASRTQVGLSARGVGVYTAPKPSSANLDTDNTLVVANVALQGSWSFDFWGKNRQQIAAVLGQRQAVAYEAEQVRLQLANAVAAQYFVWQSLAAQQDLLVQRIQLAEQSHQLVQRRISAQLLPPEALYPIELSQQRLALEQLTLTQQTAKVRNSLSALTGSAPDSLGLQALEKAVSPPALATDKIYADLLAARPDIAAQKALLEAKMHTVKATEAEFYPNIELKVLAGLSHIDAFDVIHGRTSGMLGVLPALHLPIFTSGALQSKLAGKRSEYNEQVAVYDQTVLNAMRSAADAVADYQAALAKQPVWENMLATADKSVQTARNRMKSGLDNGLPVLQKQDEALQLHMQAVVQQAELLTAWSNLHAQLGGGFKI